MLKVGIWIPLPRNTHWQGEGIARTIEFIVKGMIDEGLVGNDISLTIYTTHWTEESLQRSFRELLEDDFGKIEFQFLTDSSLANWQLPLVNALADIFFAGPVLLDTKRDFFNDLDFTNANAKGLSKRALQKYYRGMDSVDFGQPVVWPYTVRPPESQSHLGKFLYNWRMKKFCEKHSTTPEELLKNRKEIRSSRNKDRDLRKKYTTKNRDLLFNKVEKIMHKLPLGAKVLNRLVYSAEQKSFLRNILKFANVQNDEVDVWWTPSPVVQAVELLQKPNLVNFYDFFVGEYGYYWGTDQVREIYYRLSLILSRSTQVITQSRFNKYEKIVHPFEVTPEQITVCNFAGPSHYNKYVPIFEKEGVKSDRSLKQAGDIIRDEMLLRATSTNRQEDYARVGGQNDLLTRFDFENEKYIVISTQNRPYKNLKFIIDIIEDIIEKSDEPVYFFFTAMMDFQGHSDKKNPLVELIFKKRLQRYVFSVPRLPNRVHAAMYHCATMTLHPSLAEGGVGSYPFMEGMTMGTPGLSGAGDYTKEGLNIHKDYELITYRTNDKEHAINKISEILSNPGDAYEKQKPVFNAHKNWSWKSVAKVYRDALWATSGRSDYEPLMLKKNQKTSPYYEAPGTHTAPLSEDIELKVNANND